MQDMNPEMDPKQASQSFHRTIRPAYAAKKVIKPNFVKAQATTKKRSAITTAQQYRWHKTFEACLNELRDRNTGVCRVTGKTFGEVIHNYIVGGDETCFQASDIGGALVVASHDNKKAEKKSQDSRDSITLYRTGSPSGNTGPTAFLLKGKYRRTGFTDEFLVRHGAKPGSTIAMTPSAYMTEEAWLEITPNIIKGIRSMPSVRHNPQWWVLEVVDGFGPHVSSYESMKQRHDAKILVLKEEGDSSHVNQGYDKFVAKTDKTAKREGLACLRGMQFDPDSTNGNKIIDQWGLVQVGLHAIRTTTPKTWTNSFDAVNMDPRTRVGFAAWCDRIELALRTGLDFKQENSVDTYALLPTLWHGMLPAEKKKVVSIVDDVHDGKFTPACCRELQTELNVSFKDMQNLRLCYEVAKDNPCHLEMVAPLPARIEAARENPELEAAQEAAANKSVSDGLVSYQLKPKGKKMNNIELFHHMCDFRARDPNISKEEAADPSPFLDCAVSKEQRMMMAPTPSDLSRREIMKAAGGTGASQKLAKRKLDMFASIKSHSGVANDPKRLKRMQSQLEMAASLAEISRLDADQKARQKKDAANAVRDLAPKAKEKLVEKNGDVGKLSKKEISAILLVEYAIDMPATSNTKKGVLVKKLQDEISNRSEASSAAAASAPRPAESQGNDSDCEDDEMQEEESS
jgi:hypothetical protein